MLTGLVVTGLRACLGVRSTPAAARSARQAATEGCHHGRTMADVISFNQVVRERRRARERAATEACIHILEANLQWTLRLFSTGPTEERGVRARQIRQLGELLEYVTRAL